MKRRLAAILAADVAGYTALMGADESGTLQRLTELRRNFLEPLIHEHRGRIVKLMGDGLLVEFASVVDAVTCALAWQDGVVEKEATVEEDKRLRFRIGINLGDVIVEGDDIHGDGVNIATRLEGLAEPGRICLSDDAYRQARGKIEASFEDLGERDLKNVALPVRVYRVAGDSPKTAGAASKRTALSLPDKPSIAVLPFANMSGDPEQEFFADGITEDIITELSRFRGLFVIARNSSFFYKGKSVKVQEIGDDLGVAYVVEGSIRKAGNRVRVTAQLVEAATGNHVWAERYDRDLEDIFAIQDQVTGAIVTALTRRLETTDIDRAMSERPRNMAAYELYLRGRQLADRFNLEDIVKGRQFLEEAIVLDPEFARAHSSLAWVTLAETWWNPDLPNPLDEALAIGRRAIELDREDSRCHSILGIVHLFRQEFQKAEACVAQAEALNPNDYWQGMIRCHILCHLGRSQEALDRIQLLERYEPYPPNWLWDTLGIVLYDLQRFDEACEVFQKMTVLNHWNYAYLAACYGQLDRTAEAQQNLDLYLQKCPFDPLSFSTVHRDPSYTARWLEGLRKAGLSL